MIEVRFLYIEAYLKPLNFKFIKEIREDRIRENLKASKILGEKKKGWATKIDRILFFLKKEQ
jgi:hypothetical protein